jgi:tRNA A-37 threonylcarbamoyl transferase component Bud32
MIPPIPGGAEEIRADAESPTASGPERCPLPTRFGRYTVMHRPDGSLWEIGRGGMGVTYKALDESLRREVALKLIQGNALCQPQARERFRREARMAARLTHPHVATIYDVGQENETDYYVMEFIEGEDAGARLKREGPFAWQWVLRAGEQVAQALEAAWRRDVIHRDIKPANLMLAGGEGRAFAQPFVKVIDFGLARLREPDHEADAVVTLPGIFLASLAYASPEQIEGLELDTRSDIYSLGVTLWHLLTGKLPFRGTPRQLTIAHLSKAPTTSELKGQPSVLADLLCHLLEKNPNDRPADPAHLRLAIERAWTALEGAASPGGMASPPQQAPPAARASTDGGQEAYRRLAAGKAFAETYRLTEELPVMAGRRRFRAELWTVNAKEPICLEIIDPRLWSDPATRERLGSAAQAVAAARQIGLWSCSAIACDASGELPYLIRAPTTGRTLLDQLRQGAGALGRGEIRRLLEGLPAALDSLVGTAFTPLELSPESFLVDEPGRSGARFDVLHKLFEEAEASFAPEEQTLIRTVPSSAGRSPESGPVVALARLIYDLSGGSLAAADRSGYRVVTSWDESGNGVLRRALGGEFSGCLEFWNQLHSGSAPPGLSSAVSPARPVLAETPRKRPAPSESSLGGWENHLGMRFLRAPGTEVDFSIWPTRVSDYAAFAAREEQAAGQAWRQPGFVQAPDHPVVGVNLAQAQAFCRWLSATEDRPYRLPTDAEWSAAVGLAGGEAFSGRSRRFPWGEEWPPPRDVGQYAIRGAGQANTSPVGNFRANPLGLYDLGGNVWEWCTDPEEAVAKTLGVLRGGSWNTASRALAMSSARHVAPADRAANHFGFRVVTVVRR